MVGAIIIIGIHVVLFLGVLCWQPTGYATDDGKALFLVCIGMSFVATVGALLMGALGL
jgi:hypothetical protein